MDIIDGIGILLCFFGGFFLAKYTYDEMGWGIDPAFLFLHGLFIAGGTLILTHHFHFKWYWILISAVVSAIWPVIGYGIYKKELEHDEKKKRRKEQKKKEEERKWREKKEEEERQIRESKERPIRTAIMNGQKYKEYMSFMKYNGSRAIKIELSLFNKITVHYVKPNQELFTLIKEAHFSHWDYAPSISREFFEALPGERAWSRDEWKIVEDLAREALPGGEALWKENWDYNCLRFERILPTDKEEYKAPY